MTLASQQDPLLAHTVVMDARSVITDQGVPKYMTVTISTTAEIFQFPNHVRPRVLTAVYALSKETQRLTSSQFLAQHAQPQQEKSLIVRLS
jgi:hypothetical protein